MNDLHTVEVITNITDQTQKVLLNGVELDAIDHTHCGMCEFSRSMTSCHYIPCSETDRFDGRDVIFMQPKREQ